MNLSRRQEGFEKLGETISLFLSGEKNIPSLSSAIINAGSENSWFTEENIRFALASIAEVLSKEKLSAWLLPYKSPDNIKPKIIGVIMPSNIPLAGFHDFLCVIISGNRFEGKCSAQDKILLPALAELLMEIDPGYRDYIRFTHEKLSSIDAVIATGTNNTARYFEYYFGKYPAIIRKNRNSVAVLTGNEKDDEIKQLGNDIFRYFGLGCRNVSKIFIPSGYDLSRLFNALYAWNEIIHHNKYANNYTFHKAVFLMNKIKLWDNGFLLLKEDQSLYSPVSVLYYEEYENEKSLRKMIHENKEKIQCIVSGFTLENESENNITSFGRAQQPELWNYADGVDTLEFLLRLPE